MREACAEARREFAQVEEALGRGRAEAAALREETEVVRQEYQVASRLLDNLTAKIKTKKALLDTLATLPTLPPPPTSTHTLPPQPARREFASAGTNTEPPLCCAMTHAARTEGESTGSNTEAPLSSSEFASTGSNTDPPRSSSLPSSASLSLSVSLPISIAEKALARVKETERGEGGGGETERQRQERKERRAQRVMSRVQAQELARVWHVWLLYAAARRRLDLAAHRLRLRACGKQQACARAALQAWSSALLHLARARTSELEMQAQSAQASICELNRQVDDARRCSQLLDRQVAALEQELQESKRREALAHAATEHILFELREHILLELHAAHECAACTVASLRQQEEVAHETARRCAEAVSKPLYSTS
jgi:hypothetical protein